MSAIARFFKQRGDTVSGYDRTPSQLTQQLESEGIPIQYVDDPSLLPSDIDCVVYTPAVPQQTALFQHFLSSGVPMEKRSQMLGELTRGKQAIAVAGTHGKTSTTSLVAHILHHTDKGCSAFLGGIAKNFESNLVVDNNSPYVVVEADEYDRSFLQLHPYASVVTAIDDDHMDIYGTHQNLLEAFRQFASQTDPDGFIVVKQGVPLFDEEDEEHGSTEHTEHSHHHHAGSSSMPSKVVTYTARGIEADYYPWNLRNYGGNLFFDLRTPKGVIYDLELPNTSLYNVENAVAAAAVVMSLGVDENQLEC